MSVFKRILVFVGALIVLQFGASVIGGAIAGGITGTQVPTQDVAAAAMRAGVLFSIRYRPIIFALAFVLSAVLAFGFRFLTLLVSVPIAVLGFLGLQKISAVQEAQFNGLPVSNPFVSGARATPAASLIGRQVALTSPVTFNVRYGRATLPKGTMVTVLSETGDSVGVRAPDGNTLSVLRTQIQP